MLCIPVCPSADWQHLYSAALQVSKADTLVWPQVSYPIPSAAVLLWRSDALIEARCNGRGVIRKAGTDSDRQEVELLRTQDLCFKYTVTNNPKDSCPSHTHFKCQLCLWYLRCGEDPWAGNWSQSDWIMSLQNQAALSAFWESVLHWSSLPAWRKESLQQIAHYFPILLTNTGNLGHRKIMKKKKERITFCRILSGW